jgi:hypothetical protein
MGKDEGGTWKETKQIKREKRKGKDEREGVKGLPSAVCFLMGAI